MRTEIGSEFWDIPMCDIDNQYFDENTVWFLSGRIALRQVINEIMKTRVVKTVALPSWCCDSMIIPFVEAGFTISFYKVSGKEQKLSNINTDVILVMDYFGYTGYSNLKGYEGIVIRDITHSVFSKRYNDADYYFGSLRKWAGFLTGGFACRVDVCESLSECEYVDMRKAAMKEKTAYMEGMSNSKGYLKIYNDAEEYLEGFIGIKGADSDDIKAAHILDVDFIKDRRRMNAGYLLKNLCDLAIFKQIKEDDCPMFVPIIVPNGKRDALRKFLIENDVYCPIHWPISKYHQLDIDSKSVYENGLSLVCDQRYTEKDMMRMVDLINELLRRK